MCMKTQEVSCSLPGMLLIIKIVNPICTMAERSNATKLNLMQDDQ